MIAGPIRKISLERVESRADARLPSGWVESTDQKKIVSSSGDAALLYRPQHTFPTSDKQMPVLVMVAGDHPTILQHLLRAADQGTRVYVLAGPGWGEGKADPGLASRKHATVLVRRIHEVPVSGVFAHPSAQLLVGALHGKTAPWLLSLDNEQSATFRQLFLRLFWHHAIDEAWTTGAPLAFRPVGEAPFDVPEMPRESSLKLLPGVSKLPVSSHHTSAYLNGDVPPNEGPRTLWLAPSGAHHPRLEQLTRSGTQVVGGALDLPDLALEQWEGTMLLPGTTQRLAIVLNALQVAEARKVLEGTPPWRFETNIRIGDYAARLNTTRFWLPEAKAPAQLEPQQLISQGEVLAASIRATPQVQPSTWTSPGPLALSVKYTWEGLPPRIAPGSEPDLLLGQWRKVDLDYGERLKKGQEALAKTKGHQGRIRNGFKRLISAVMGFERTQSGLELDLSRLAQAIPSAEGPQGAHTRLEQLAVAEEQLRRLATDLEESERKAKEDEEREKQEREWNTRIEDARRALSAQRSELAQKQSKHTELEQRLPALDQQLLELAQPRKADDPADEQEQAKVLQQRDQQKRDLDVQRKRTADELAQVSKELVRLRSEIKDLEQRAKEPFVFRPSIPSSPKTAPSGPRFVPGGGASQPVGAHPGASNSATSHPGASIPAEALPSIGDLRSHKGQRYLVIRKWEELEAGERDATRLKAKLVAPEGT